MKVIMHQTIPPVPSPLPTPTLRWPLGISIFFALDGKFPGVGTVELSKKEGKCPVFRQHCNLFSLIAQSNSVILGILMCDFWFQ